MHRARAACPAIARPVLGREARAAQHHTRAPPPPLQNHAFGPTRRVRLNAAAWRPSGPARPRRRVLPMTACPRRCRRAAPSSLRRRAVRDARSRSMPACGAMSRHVRHANRAKPTSGHRARTRTAAAIMRRAARCRLPRASRARRSSATPRRRIAPDPIAGETRCRRRCGAQTLDRRHCPVRAPVRQPTVRYAPGPYPPRHPNQHR